MKVLLTGGGTLGSVTPLLAVAEELRKQKPATEFLWLGTKTGPEKKLIGEYQIPFKPIFNGKFRRYLSWQNFIDPFFIGLGFCESLWIICRFKPDIILSAGSFVSVPVVWAGWFLRRPSLIHQQDIMPGLANRLMAPVAKRITVSFEKSLKDFPAPKAVWTGNPVRNVKCQMSNVKYREFFKLEDNLPTILVSGGGTGALELNELIVKSLPELTKFCQIIHLTGKDKIQNSEFRIQNSRYHPYEFFTHEMLLAYDSADLVVCRAGMGTLTELSVLEKPAIIIPIPESHQEANAKYFKEQGSAIILSQKDLTREKLVKQVEQLLGDKNKLKDLGEKIGKLMKKNAAANVAAETFRLLNSGLKDEKKF